MFLQNLIEQMLYYICTKPYISRAFGVMLVVGLLLRFVYARLRLREGKLPPAAQKLGDISLFVALTSAAALACCGVVWIIMKFSTTYHPGDPLKSWQFFGAVSALLAFIFFELGFAFKGPETKLSKTCRKICEFLLYTSIIGCTVVPLIWSFF